MPSVQKHRSPRPRPASCRRTDLASGWAGAGRGQGKPTSEHAQALGSGGSNACARATRTTSSAVSVTASSVLVAGSTCNDVSWLQCVRWPGATTGAVATSVSVGVAVAMVHGRNGMLSSAGAKRINASATHHPGTVTVHVAQLVSRGDEAQRALRCTRIEQWQPHNGSTTTAPQRRCYRLPFNSTSATSVGGSFGSASGTSGAATRTVTKRQCRRDPAIALATA